jgi:serine/threonine protein kinase
MKDVIVEIQESTAIKRSTTDAGQKRMNGELISLELLHTSSHVPQILSKTRSPWINLTLEFIAGQNAKQWLSLDDEWNAVPIEWSSAKTKLKAYVTAEMDLLSRGALYRDLNLEHMIFHGDKVVLVDHEATLTNQDGASQEWYLDNRRGTWDTMAPEEFSGRGKLTRRTATYRTAVVAHLVLTGRLPFERRSLRSDTYKWRRQNPPKVSTRLSKSTRRVFSAALSRKPTHRHKDPATFFEALRVSIGQ